MCQQSSLPVLPLTKPHIASMHISAKLWAKSAIADTAKVLGNDMVSSFGSVRYRFGSVNFFRQESVSVRFGKSPIRSFTSPVLCPVSDFCTADSH